MLAILKGNKRIIAITAAAVVVVAAVLVTVFLLINRNEPVAAGESVIITVTADTLEDAYGYQFQMNYDEDILEYTGTLTSKVEDIQTIFSKPFYGYELVGATMIGEKAGINGSHTDICELVFTAKQDTTVQDLGVSVSEVNIVKSDLKYIEGIDGWGVSAELMK